MQTTDLKTSSKINQSFWQWNLKTNEVKLSRSFEYLFGLEVGQISPSYEALMNFIHPDDRVLVKEALEHSLRTLSSYKIEHRIVWRNGEIHWVEGCGEVVLDEDNTPFKLLGYIKNIDHVVLLRENNELLNNQVINQSTMTDALLRGLNSHSLVSITDNQGVITYVNENFCRSSLYQMSELIGKNHSVLSSNIHGKKFWGDFWEKIKTGKIYNNVFINKSKFGEYYYLDTTVIPILSEQSGITQYLSISTDVTHYKRLNEEIGKYSSELEEKVEEKINELKVTQAQLVQSAKLAALGEMSSGLAHELNNPLFLIQGFAVELKEKLSLSRQELDQADLIEDADEIYKNCLRMNSLIKHFREFTRISSTEFESVDIHAAINRSLHFFKEQFRLQQIEVNLQLDSPSYIIDGIGSRLEQVFVNLLSNSRDALSQKSMKDKKLILIKTKKIGTNIIIYFNDNGVGIPPENLDKIANPFFTTKSISHGTGLGLSIAHSIIDEVRGSVVCRSTQNEFTEFEITLPLKG